MYIFNDRNMVGVGVAGVEDCALSVITTVVSTSVSGRAIIDGGSKTFPLIAISQVMDEASEWSRKIETEGELSEEHGHLNIKRSLRKYSVGERLTVIPNHVCSTVNMHDETWRERRTG
jgi:D-serine deaminase-like pyridoxal phosphate-dependent protein